MNTCNTKGWQEVGTPSWYLLVFWSFCWSTLALGQSPLQIEWDDTPPANLDWTLPDTLPALDSLQLLSLLETPIRQLRLSGYLAANVDHLVWADSSWLASLHLGDQYSWAQIDLEGVPEGWLRQAGVRIDRLEGKVVDWLAWFQIQEQLLEYAENHGYPFARVSVRQIQGQGEQLGALIHLETGPPVEFAAFEISGDLRLSNNYLENALGLRPGDLYSRRAVLNIRQRIEEIPFLAEASRPKVRFEGTQAFVELDLQRKKASRFDFIIGVLPNQDELVITGTLDADLQNTLGRGERLFLSFERLRPGTQDLELGFSYPYLLDLPFGLDFGLQQYRRDSAFNDVIFDLGVRYLFRRGNHIRAFWSRTGSTILSVNEQQVINLKRLPATLDLTKQQYGLAVHLAQLDYRLNPRRGWQIDWRGGIGNRTIERNQLIAELEDPGNPEFDFNTLYDTLNLQTIQWTTQGKLQAFIPLFRSTTLRLAAEGGWIAGEDPVYRNEQFRIGGNDRLRGFDEESIFAGLFSILTAEYRLLLDRNSYLFTFVDYAYLEDETPDQRLIDRPLGFGAGLSFQTRAGVFGISLAVGRQFDNPIDFRNPKVHFGYVNLF